MARITVSDIWTDGWALVQRHLPTVGPIAAAFLFLPQVLDAAIAGPPKSGETALGWGGMIAALVGIFGQLAIASILLGGPRAPATVGGALSQSARLTPRFLMIFVLLIVAAIPVVLLAGAALAALGVKPDPASIRAGGSGVTFIVVALLALGLYVGARLLPMMPTLIGEDASPLATLKRSWSMTRGEGSRLTLFLLSFIAAALFATIIAMVVGGAVIGLLLGSTDFSLLLQATVVGVIATVFGLGNLGASVVVYRRLAQ